MHPQETESLGETRFLMRQEQGSESAAKIARLRGFPVTVSEDTPLLLRVLPSLLNL